LNHPDVPDIGTGTGIFAGDFPDRGLAVTGIDMNPRMIGKARVHAPGARFETCDMESLPFADDQFDLVFKVNVLHEAENINRALFEAVRVSRKRIALLEWPFIREEQGPPLHHRVSSQAVLSIAGKLSVSSTKSIPLSYMKLYILEKNHNSDGH